MAGLFGIILDITDRKHSEETLKASLQEKEVLPKEIRHRVKNNLQIISSLLSIQSRYAKDEVTAEVLKECHNRVRSMALIVDRRQVKLKLDLEDVFLGIDKAIPSGLIINELVSNCLKHAFLHRRIYSFICETIMNHDGQGAVKCMVWSPKSLNYVGA